jgi:glutamate dehydrogenase
MTDEVARLVLQDNYYQTQALDIAGHRPLYLLDGQQRLMQWQEGGKRLNRALEYLPDDAEIARRRARGDRPDRARKRRAAGLRQDAGV